METRRKMKLGTSDKVILGVGYTLLGLFVLAVFVPLVYDASARLYLSPFPPPPCCCWRGDTAACWTPTGVCWKMI